MGLRINTNTSSIAAQRALGITKNNLDSNLRKLSSGERITRASDDAAGLAISEKLKGHIRGLRQAKRNSDDGVSLIQTAEGALSEISNIVIRLRELSIQAASDTVGDTERGFSNIEFQNLLEEVQRISQGSEFNGRKLLDGTGGVVEIQVGIHNDPTTIESNMIQLPLTLHLKHLASSVRELLTKKAHSYHLLNWTMLSHASTEPELIWVHYRTVCNQRVTQSRLQKRTLAQLTQGSVM